MTPVPLQGPIATLDDAYRYAYAMAQSGLLPKDLRNNAPNTLIVILYGQYLGIPPVIATQVISVVNGRPQIEGKMLVAKVREAGHKYRVVEHTPTVCRVRITRCDEPDDPYEAVFTLDEAVQAGLCRLDKDGTPRARSENGRVLPWETYTKDMLQWRATGRCVNTACPEVKMGLAVEGEETTELGARAGRLGRVTAGRGDQQHTDTVDGGLADVAAQLARMEAGHIPATDPESEDAALPVDTGHERGETDRWDEVVEAELAEQQGQQ